MRSCMKFTVMDYSVHVIRYEESLVLLSIFIHIMFFTPWFGLCLLAIDVYVYVRNKEAQQIIPFWNKQVSIMSSIWYIDSSLKYTYYVHVWINFSQICFSFLFLFWFFFRVFVITLNLINAFHFIYVSIQCENICPLFRFHLKFSSLYFNDMIWWDDIFGSNERTNFSKIYMK